MIPETEELVLRLEEEMDRKENELISSRVCDIVEFNNLNLRINVSMVDLLF